MDTMQIKPNEIRKGDTLLVGPTKDVRKVTGVDIYSSGVHVIYDGGIVRYSNRQKATKVIAECVKPAPHHKSLNEYYASNNLQIKQYQDSKDNDLSLIADHLIEVNKLIKEKINR